MSLRLAHFLGRYRGPKIRGTELCFHPLASAPFRRREIFSIQALSDLSTISALARAKSSLGVVASGVTSSDEPDGSFLSASPPQHFPRLSHPTTFAGAFFRLSTTCRKYCTALRHYCWNMTCDTPSFLCPPTDTLRLPTTLLIETRCQVSFPRSNPFGSRFRAPIFAAPCLALRLNLFARCVDWLKTAKASTLGARRW